MTPSGFETLTLRLVTQCFNQMLHQVPRGCCLIRHINVRFEVGVQKVCAPTCGFFFNKKIRFFYIMSFHLRSVYSDRLCGLVVSVSGYRYRGPGFDPRRYQIF